MGFEPIFCFYRMYQQNKKLVELIGPVITNMGYDMLGVEIVPQGRSTLVRIYIDKKSGISITDCEQVSQFVVGVMDVDDPIQGSYTLEVSSPGLDRPVFTLEQFENYSGCKVHVKISGKLEGRRKITGVIEGTKDGIIIIREEDETYHVPGVLIEHAHLIPEIDKVKHSKRKN